MYELHIANKNYSSWSLRPWVLMQELNIPFKEHIHTFTNGTNWQQFRDFSPTGQVPCLIDGQQTIWDSLAIVEYLAEKHPNIWPQSSEARAWARCAAAEMHAGFFQLRNQCPMTCGLRIKLNEINDALAQDIKRIDELWNQGLKKFKGPFLVGQNFSAVDAFFAPVAFRVQTYDLSMSKNAQNYMTLLLSLESMKKWYDEALIEPWREPDHEQETIDTGTIIKDNRIG